MPDNDNRQTGTYVQQIIDKVSSWDHVTTGTGRFNSETFTLASREFGHIHRWGALDIGFSRSIRNQLLTEGKTGPHHINPDSGATTLHVESEADIERALWLLRFSSLCQARTLQRTPDEEEVIDIDVEATLHDMGVSDDLLATVESTGP